jgi:hypothetical protein
MLARPMAGVIARSHAGPAADPIGWALVGPGARLKSRMTVQARRRSLPRKPAGKLGGEIDRLGASLRMRTLGRTPAGDVESMPRSSPV